ncbi:hypothetical protein BD779DRAFT_21803 [Infundibulicybe gibba]|nr:hypothetical protein BD779DRAFT_21803 [Infundibulicybe gibba]
MTTAAVLLDQSNPLDDTQREHETEAHDIAQPDTIIQSVKITASESKEAVSPVLDSSRGPSFSTTGEPSSDVASVHSMPAVHVSEAEAPFDRHRSAARTPEPRSTDRAPPPSPHPSTSGDRLSQQERRTRHRSAAEVRSSNRLSGFFNNLIHRRENVSQPPPRGSIREDHAPSPGAGQDSENPSRASSPTSGRPITPPPQLPPPTLQELGLSLSVLTSDLSPSHFSTPPSSGAFLAPHYLLLCHAQGLDVLPLVSPPSPQPYALVRRVSFKSVVVMEQRGVLVAIAGRRDGVRVYALEEVKKAIEWRMEAEVRRERERNRRETIKKVSLSAGLDVGVEWRDSTDKQRKASLSTPPAPASLPAPPSQPTLQEIPVPSVTGISSSFTASSPLAPPPGPSENPPPYSSPVDVPHPPRLRAQSSVVSMVQGQSRRGSVSNVLAAAPISRRNTDAATRPHDPDSKADWAESSDEEAIDIVAAGSSGGQALDERTSAMPPLSATQISPATSPPSTSATPHPATTSPRRNRPSNLDLTLSRSNTTVVPPEPSPTPTLLTLRQALSHSPVVAPRSIHSPDQPNPDLPFGEADGDDDDANGRISLAQALLESRIPDLPPIGTRQPQQPILIVSSHPVATWEDEPTSPRTSEGHSVVNRQPPPSTPERRRRRWSVMLGQSSPVPESNNASSPPPTAPPSFPSQVDPERSSRFSRSQSFRSSQSTSTVRPSTSTSGRAATIPVPSLPELAPSVVSSNPSRSSRFIPRIISNAFHQRRSESHPPVPSQNPNEGDSSRRTNGPIAPHMPPPKLEYVKLPGTKGALLIKAVETAKKSFLAILCGENGEKVELFAGTYRTALGLSRTFILPDSPRSLELQLQGDDLVEVFLVFSQNVFGLEPATVRVREVRIGRAERRAARRRAREVRTGNDPENPPDEDTNVNVSIGVSVAVGSTVVATGDGPGGSQPPTLIPTEHPSANDDPPSNPADSTAALAVSHADELVALATVQMGPYTTFQQLSFAPKFPLASIADEYIIPPTYPDFLEYRAEHEPEVNGNNNLDLAQIQFSPPGLPVPEPTAPSKWYYRDPKNVIHGPWKAQLMQAWYKDGLLPPDLPVRREEDSNYMLLKDLRLQSVDPTHPFRSHPSPSASTPNGNSYHNEKPLLPPISLLSQPRHFGPPALFFSSRGGHSTTIVDARGRSVLKGRFMWSGDNHDDDSPTLMTRMGDVKRLEAFDVKDRAVLVAMRQGGLEAVDLGDALLKPADESRTVLPQFSPPPSNTNRRGPFVWKIGTPVSATPTTATILSSKSKGGAPLSSKKQSTGSAKSPAGRTEFSAGELDVEMDEVLFLGRKEDEIYICERNAGSFRILRLRPDSW